MTTEKRRILIVDDEVQSTHLLKRILEKKRPYEVLIENDSRNALSVTVAFKPHLILLDVIMPHHDGGDVAIQIRHTPSVHDVPIVFISASARPIEGYPFLAKPVPVEEMIACIEENLALG